MAQAWPSLEPKMHERMRLVLGESVARRSFTSRLNNDGSPLQVCISAGQAAISVYLIADPGSDAPDVTTHHARGLACIDRVTSGESYRAARHAIARGIAMNLPGDPAAADGLTLGTIWLGLPIQGPGVTVYLNAAWGATAAQWERVSAWLKAEGVPAVLSQTTIDRLRTIARPAAVGLDFVPGRPLRLKVYFRLAKSAKLSTFGDPAWTSEAVCAFLQETIRGQRISPSGLTFCAEFLPEATDLAGVKVDVCAHCLGYDTRDWGRILSGTARALGTRPFQIASWNSGRDTEIAVVGVGRRFEGAIRCNLYLKECT
jgi:hypothetical protein